MIKELSIGLLLSVVALSSAFAGFFGGALLNQYPTDDGIEIFKGTVLSHIDEMVSSYEFMESLREPHNSFKFLTVLVSDISKPEPITLNEVREATVMALENAIDINRTFCNSRYSNEEKSACFKIITKAENHISKYGTHNK